jgi:hypothetical protein
MLLDISMPYGPNWDYYGALQQIPETSGVPIIVTTSNKRALEDVVGPSGAIELTGTTANLRDLTAAIMTATTRTPA